MTAKEEKILLEAEKLFAEKGFSGTSTRAIAAAAQVNISMICYYFGSKEKLFESVFEFRMKEGLSYAYQILEQKNINGMEKFVLLIDRYTDRIRTLKNFYRILQREQISLKDRSAGFLKESKKSFVTVYQSIIKEGQQEGIFTKDPNLAFLHSMITGTLFNGLNAISVYKEFFDGGDDYESHYIEEMKHSIKNVLKYLLGYEKEN